MLITGHPHENNNVLEKSIFKSTTFCFLSDVIQSLTVQGCLMATLCIWYFPKLNIIFSPACFEAIVQILSEIVIFFGGQ